MKRKYFSLVLIFHLMLCTETRAQNEKYSDNDIADMMNYSDSIVTLATEGKIIVYDSLMQPLSVDSVNRMCLLTDTVINDQATRPKFINNVYHPNFDGVAVTRMIFFESASFGSDAIKFSSPFNRDKLGNMTGDARRIYFVMKRHTKPVDPASIKKEEKNKIKKDEASLKIYSAIKNSEWRNDSLYNGSKLLLMDSCQKKFKIRFNADLTFNQSYAGAVECFTDEMYPDIEVGIGGDNEQLERYWGLVQGCYINNPSGLWKIANHNLILTTQYGREILRFKIEYFDEQALSLSINDYRVTLKRKE